MKIFHEIFMKIYFIKKLLDIVLEINYSGNGKTFRQMVHCCFMGDSEIYIKKERERKKKKN